MLGILLVDKPRGCTSHDVVATIRRRFQVRRVGHAGTLDPLATGLLVVAVGPATRFLQYLPLEPKEYVGEVTFGVKTTTMDAEGEVVATCEPPKDLDSRIEEALPAFRGLIAQLPPMHSAVKKDGKPLYAYAREGHEVERRPRTVHIGHIEASRSAGAVVDVKVVCSGGTYIRSLAHDLGEVIECGAHLSALRRVGVGRFSLHDAVPLDSVQKSDLLALSDALPPMPIVTLDEDACRRIREGRQVAVSDAPREGLVGLAGADGLVIGIARALDHCLQPECVIPAEAHDA